MEFNAISTKWNDKYTDLQELCYNPEKIYIDSNLKNLDPENSSN